MAKNKVLIIVLTVVLLSAATGYYLFRSATVYEAIPETALAAMEVQDWNQLNSQLSLTATGIEFKKTPVAKKLFSEINIMHQLLSSDKTLATAAVSGKTVASLHLTSAAAYDFLFTTALSGVNDNTLLNRVQSAPITKGVSVRVFRNKKVVDVLLKDGKQLSFALLKGVLVYSFTPFLTENGITALSTGDNLCNDKNFKEVKSNSRSAAICLYFNFSKTDVILPLVFRPQQSLLLHDISQTGTWGRYDISFTNGSVVFDGVVSMETETLPNGKNLLSGNLLAQIPDNAAYLELTHTDTTTKAHNDFFTGWSSGVQANVILEPLNSQFTDQCIFILGTDKPQLAQKDLIRWMALHRSPAAPVDTFQNYLIFYSTDSVAIHQLSNSRLLQFTSPYFAVTNQAVIFANNADVLKLLLEKISKGETLDKDQDFKQTEFARMGMNSSLQYANIHRSSLLLQGLLPDSSSIFFTSTFKNVLCVSNLKERKRYSRIVFYSGGQPAATSGLLWRTKLQTSSIYTPQIVFNNRNGDNEIITQDTSGNVYLISKSGEILFTKKIEGAIVGGVHQIDYYRNGSLQYIFNTAHEVYIIDRLGNDVSQYPLRLSANANGGMLLQNGRYYIPCQNGNVYGYAYNGKPLSGWSPRGGIGMVEKPLLDITLDNQSVIVAVNTQGKVFLLDEKGNTKWVLADIPETTANFTAVPMGHSFKLLNVSANQLVEISASGSYTLKELIDTALAFTLIRFSDSTYHYYYANGSQMRCYNQLDEFQNATNTDSMTVTSLNTYSTKGQKYLIMSDSTRKQLLVTDSFLKPVCSFNYPSAASFTVTDLFNKGGLNLVATDQLGHVLCYRLK